MLGTPHQVTWKWLAWACLAVLGAWLMHPALTAPHVEGYAAQLQAMAIALDRGGLEGLHAFDTYMPLPAEFLYLTRPGVVWLLAAAHRLAEWSGDWGFRAIVLISAAAIFVSSATFARRWAGVPPEASVLALLLAPGVSELAFFLSDNIVSAGFAAAGMAVVTRRGSPRSHFLAGVLLGCAAACRIDAVLALPMLGLLALAGRPRPLELASRVAASAAGLLAVLAALLTIGGTNPLDALAVAEIFSQGRGDFHAGALSLFLGAPVAAASALGLCAGAAPAIRERNWWWFVTLVAFPALLCAAALTIAANLRYGLPLLAPFLAVHGGRGFEVMARQLAATGWPRSAAAAAWVVVVAGAAAPPDVVPGTDGPNSSLGRLRTPPLWLEWQATVAAMPETVRPWLDRLDAEGGRTLVVTAHFEDDFHMRLHLLRLGYSTRAGHGEAGCRGLFVYERDGRTVLHVRAEPLYWLPAPRARLEPAMLEAALGCGEAASFDRAYLTTVGRGPLEITPGLYGHIVARADERATMQILPLSREDVSTLATSARRLAQGRIGNFRNLSFGEILAAYRSRQGG